MELQGVRIDVNKLQGMAILLKVRSSGQSFQSLIEA